MINIYFLFIKVIKMLIIPLFLVLLVTILLITEKKLAQQNSASTIRFVSYLPAITKILASSLLVIFFYFNSTILSTFSLLFFCAVVFSFAGDLLLIAKSRSEYFLVGITAFGLAHISYSFAFFQLTLDWYLLAFIAPIGLTTAILTFIWLKPYLKNHYKKMVPSYLTLISIMLILGLTVGFSLQNYWFAAGSLLFAISDIFVARNRFIKAEFNNRLIGLPLYYLGQMMLIYAAITEITKNLSI